jgi:membrane-bound metal-dependent hydrolase YbcI (DUF457 family)
MFVGHFALGFAARRIVPNVPLAALFGAAQLADLLWPVLVAAGIERVSIDPGHTAMTPLDFLSYPYSHSLAMLALWGAIVAWMCARLAPGRLVFAVIFLLVISHWFLDYLTHVPDMPLYPGGPTFGLGLWNHPLLENAIEIPMYLAGVAIYLRATRARDGVGRWGLLALAVFLLVGYLASGAPPPSVTALWATTLVGGVLILVWTYWADRHRSSVHE